jgi:hypothetical protein
MGTRRTRMGMAIQLTPTVMVIRRTGTGTGVSTALAIGSPAELPSIVPAGTEEV